MRSLTSVGWLLAAVCITPADAETTSVEGVCKAAIAAIMGRDPTSIKIDNRADGIIRLSYVRQDDNTRWTYRCKIEGDRVIWAADPGRWRTHGLDEKITFESDGSEVTITQTFSDGSKLEESFPSNKL